MANGDPTTGQSKAPYIILCGGRIELLAAKNNPAEQIAAASRAAAALSSFYDLKGWLTVEDSQPISSLQHKMMDAMADGINKYDAHGMAEEMIQLLEDLEQKYLGKEGGGYESHAKH